MTLSLSSLSTSSSSSTLDSLVESLVELESTHLEKLETEQQDLTETSAMYTDIKDMLETLEDAIDDLLSTDSDEMFNTKTVTSTDEDVVTATADGDAADTTHTFTVSQLATSEQVASDRVDSTSESTGHTGTIRVQDAVIEITEDNNSLEGICEAINDATYEDGRSVTASIIDNRLVIQTDDTGADNLIALSDLSGDVLSGLGIITGNSTDLASSATVTSESTGSGTGTTTIDLGSVQTVSRLDFDSGATGVPKDYTIEVSEDGETWTTVKTVTDGSSSDDSDGIFNSVSARYVRINVTSTSDGSDPSISDVEVYNDTDTYGNELTKAQDAVFTVDGVSATRSSNTDLTDVLTGMTVTLNGTTEDDDTAKLTVSADVDAMEEKIQAFLDALNEVTSYIKDKSSVTEEDDGTYTRGDLCGKSTYTSLRSSLYSALVQEVDGGDSIYSTLTELGITMDDDLNFTISDTDALEDALADNTSDVASLFTNDEDGLATRLKELLEPYTDTGGILDTEIDGVEEEIDNVETKITRENEYLERYESQMRTKYAYFEELITEMNSDASYIEALFGSSDDSDS